MNIYFIKADAVGMSRDDVEHELSVMAEVLSDIGGNLLRMDIRGLSNRVTGYVQAESGQAIGDLFEASDLSVTRIEFVGTSHASHRPAVPSGHRAADVTAGNWEERSLWVHQLGLS